MAASIPGVFDEDLRKKILEAKIFVVGAGGIGCELLKNLVLCGFKDIELIDLDTIDVSNLNRQFLFHKEHIGRSKAEVAAESVLKLNPDAKIKFYQNSVICNTYNTSFFARFDVVLNALDNVTARNHVNRMCLASGVPLIESGTAGYSGQVELIKKGLTKCYECETKRGAKQYPGCTIRNTPAEPIHCIVWAKHLFNQLFGEADPDEDVSPDTEDPELSGDSAAKALNHANGAIQRKSTRVWAQECGYNSDMLLKKLFNEDILYLLSMHNLWEKRTPPTPLNVNDLPDAVAGSSKHGKESAIKGMNLWSVAECVQIFKNSVEALKKETESIGSDGHLVWDKDDKHSMNFVAACANIRAYVFGIEQKSPFEIKSMAGNIIPAIATSNAITAGVVVFRTFNVLREQFLESTTVYLRQHANHRGQLVVNETELCKPNPKCYICRPNPQVLVECCIETMKLKDFEAEILKKALNMAAPDAIFNGNVIISSEEGETEHNNEKTLVEIGIFDEAVLKIDDFLQNYSLTATIKNYVAGRDEPEYKVNSFGVELGPQAPTEKNGTNESDEDDIELTIISAPKTDIPTTKRKQEEANFGPPKKRPRDSGDIITL